MLFSSLMEGMRRLFGLLKSILRTTALKGSLITFNKSNRHCERGTSVAISCDAEGDCFSHSSFAMTWFFRAAKQELSAQPDISLKSSVHSDDLA